MRATIAVLLLFATGCAGALYQRYAGDIVSPPDEAYACVQSELSKMSYRRSQFDVTQRWYLGQKESREQNSSGLYRKTLQTLDVKVKPGATGSTLEITAHTYQEYANARGIDQQEQTASEEVKRDAQLLARACSGTQP